MDILSESCFYFLVSCRDAPGCCEWCDAMIAVNCRSGKSCSMLSNYASMAIVKPAPGVVWTTCTGGSVNQLLPGITESACFSIPGLLLKNENVAIEQYSIRPEINRFDFLKVAFENLINLFRM